MTKGSATANFSAKEYGVKLSTKDLSAEERIILNKHYGLQPNWDQKAYLDRLTSFDVLINVTAARVAKGAASFFAHPIVGVSTLTKNEEWFFERQGFVSPHFCVQFLYKVRSSFSYVDFQREIYRLIDETPEMCVNFCQMPKRILKVTSKGLLPEINYRTIDGMAGESVDIIIKKMMQRDMEVGFNLLMDPLLRISVINTGHNECAIIVTESQLIVNAWNPQLFFLTAFHAIKNANGVQRLRFSGNVGGKETDGEKSPRSVMQEGLYDMYWRAALKDLPILPPLPGYKKSSRPYEQRLYRADIAEETKMLLFERAGKNKSQLISILQVAWGLFLQTLCNTKDAYCCIVMPEPHANTVNASATAAVINPMMMRLRCEDATRTVAETAADYFRGLITGQSFVCMRMTELLDNIGVKRDSLVYFLSFHGFMLGGKKYYEAEARPEGKCVAIDSWDAKGMDLGIYFRYENDNINVSFRYNANCFFSADIERLARGYFGILRGMLVDWKSTLREFWAHSGVKVKRTSVKTKSLDGIKMQKVLQYFDQMEIFKAVNRESLNMFAASAGIYNCLNDSMLPPADEDLMLFLAWGGIEKHIGLADGSTLMLGKIYDKVWLNENIILPNFADEIILKIASSPAVIISLPLGVAEKDKVAYAHFMEYAKKSLQAFIPAANK